MCPYDLTLSNYFEPFYEIRKIPIKHSFISFLSNRVMGLQCNDGIRLVPGNY